MAEQETEEEPSIEEILASIRQIISDDDEEQPSEEGAPAADVPAEEVVELTEEVAQPDVTEPEPAIVSEPEPDPIEEVLAEPEPEEIDIIMEEVVPESVAAPVAAAPAQQEDDSLLTSRAEAAAMEGFADVVRKTAIEHNGITLEEIVRTELRPLLKGWLDDNLPPIIERLVQEELKRVSKRALEEL